VTRRRATRTALVTVACAVVLGACGSSESVGSLEGDQGAGSALDRRTVCERFEEIVNDSSLEDDEVRERLADVADDTISDDLAGQVRSAANAIDGDGAREVDPPHACGRD
jgi:hypothetical protein